MITRNEAKKVLIDGLKNQMRREGKTLEDVAVMSPKKGKNSWTFKEVIDSIEQDINLEDSECNMVDDYLHYLEWKEKRELNELHNRVNK